ILIMSEIKTECNPNIIRLLEAKASTKQLVYRETTAIFARLKEQINKVATSLNNTICEIDKHVVVEFRDKGNYEGEIHFSGDILLFNMHTNVFTFDANHPMWKTGYIKEDKRRAYFGMINIYNFLADSFKFNRLNDV